MPKLVVTENETDLGLTSIGGGTVIIPTGQTTGVITTPIDQPKYNVEFLSSEIKHDEEMPYEIATIKVSRGSLQGNFFSNVRADFSSGAKTNHFFKLPSMVDLASTKTESYSTAKSQASYSFETVFNYISEDYDKLQVGISEANLYAPFDNPAKKSFLGSQGGNTEVINFSRGSQMQNLVLPVVQVQQGTGESPYYNSLRINQRLDNNISNFTTKLGIFDDLLQDYLFGTKTFVSFDTQLGQELNQETMTMYHLESFLTTTRELDIDNFFTQARSTPPSRMSLDLRKHLMKGFLKDVSKTGFRTYKDVYQNREAHKEVFCYSVAKHDGVVTNSTPIQTIYAPANEESTPIIDTQVKYGKTYGYKVVGHYLVVGNSYEYRQKLSVNDPDDTHSIIEVINRPTVVMMPFDIFTKEVNVVQMPPVYPQVSFKTKNDSSKMISMYLSPTKTEITEPFQVITKEDGLQQEALYRLPNARDLLGNVRFKTYGDQGLYEVFRLSSPPKNYTDFREAKLGEISMPFNTTNAIFKDVVIPNKKYYYMFRSVSQKGMVSNPTMVYEATLLIDADESKVITDTYHFPKPRNMESSLEFRKLFRIIPAVEHVLFDNNQPALFNKDSLVGTLDDLKLGINQKAVWGRKFKIRIKSKTSGKMIDIILNVDLTKNKTEEEF